GEDHCITGVRLALQDGIDDAPTHGYHDHATNTKGKDGGNRSAHQRPPVCSGLSTRSAHSRRLTEPHSGRTSATTPAAHLDPGSAWPWSGAPPIPRPDRPTRRRGSRRWR